MPVQTQQSSLAGKLGGRLAAVNGECTGQPLDLGRQRLPGGIKSGVAKVQSLVWKVQENEDGKIPKGELYFSGSAVALYPVTHDGIKVAGRQTFFQIPLCDVPAKGVRKASSFKDNFNKFRSLMQSLGAAPCPENQQTDPTGAKTEAYWLAVMKGLTNPQRPQGPVYVAFETRSWSPPAPLGTPPGTPPPEPMVLEEWHGGATAEQIAKLSAASDPAAGVSVISSEPPPFDDGAKLPNSRPTSNGAAHTAPTATPDAAPNMDLEDEVAALIEVASGDTDPPTEEEESARKRLEDLAWAAGWTKEETDAPPEPYSNDWESIGQMALNPPDRSESQAPIQVGPTVDVGSKWMFVKRAKDGSKLKRGDKDIAAQEVEVVSADEATRTCVVKTTKDGKEVVNMGDKKPTQVKFEWLESIK